MESTRTASTDLAAAAPLDAGTVALAFQRIVHRRPDDIALRSIDGTVAITWQEAADRVRQLAAGLSALGVRRGDTVAMVLPNTIESHLLDYALLHLGAVTFSIFNSSPAVQIADQLRNSDARVVLVNDAVRDRVVDAARILASDQVRHIVGVDGTDADRFAGLDRIAAGGRPDFDFDEAWTAVQPDDLIALVYTSGTVGPPKGAQLSHHGVLSDLRSLAAGVPIPTISLVSFLPMAHVSGRIAVHYMALMHGATITECPDVNQLPKALGSARPDALFSVPRFWEKLRVAIEGLVAAEPDPAVSARMRLAIETGIEWAGATERGSRLSPEAIADLEARHQAELPVLRPLLARLGIDRIVSAFVGGAPAPRELSMFFRAVGIPMLDAYGSTEALLCIFNQIDNFKTGTVGRPLPGVQVRLAEDGELLVKAESNFVGYRKQPVETGDALDAQGWLHTGDLATIDSDGFVRIVDRKKEIIINSAGKNMSPANIEAAVKNETTLAGQVVAVGDGRKYVTALITVDPEAAATYAVQRMPGATHQDIVSSPGLQAEIDAAVSRANMNLHSNEAIKRYVLLPDVWLPGGDELTPTGKLKRRVILTKYADPIDELYR